MALQLNLTQTQFGSPAPQAYAKITNFFGNKDNIQVQVSVYFSKDARDANMSTVMEHAHYISIEDLKGKGDLIPAIYEVLKTMSPYLGATDV
jgi:virulence-associated protein VapD